MSTSRIPAAGHSGGAVALPERPGGLVMEGATLAYESREIARDLSLTVHPGSFTVIIGPNACGKSTSLRALANLLRPRAGAITLDGRDIHRMPSRDLARRLGLLPQSASAPEGISVADLVTRGRYPHQSMFSRWSAEDEQAVAEALEVTGMTDLSSRSVDELSGGQRQRAWVALVLAQRTDLMLLDEPTTFLDIAHQISLLDLFAELNARGRTLVAVLHDINHAARYASDLVVMREGGIYAQGRPAEVISSQMLAEVFGIEAEVIEDPVNGGPLVVPRHSGAH